MIRPEWPRTSSAASGFFFCGMIELPVDRHRAALTKPKGWLAQMMNSSASRDRCKRTLRRRHQIIEREIAVGHRIEAVGGRHGKAQRLGGHLAVDRKAGSRQSRRAQRALAGPGMGIDETRTIPADHFVIGHQMMPQRDRLRGLQMREARHDAVGMFLGPGDQRDLQRAQRGIGLKQASRTHSLKSVAT